MGGAPVVDLPVARECQHDHVVYHYVDGEGRPQAVALAKAARLVRFAVWEPVHMYWRSKAGTRHGFSLADKERYWADGALTAYQELNANRYEQGFPLQQQEVYVRVGQVGFWVCLGLVEHRHIEPVWVDGNGKVWY